MGVVFILAFVAIVAWWLYQKSREYEPNTKGLSGTAADVFGGLSPRMPRRVAEDLTRDMEAVTQAYESADRLVNTIRKAAESQLQAHLDEEGQQSIIETERLRRATSMALDRLRLKTDVVLEEMAV